ncbi:hypothetical protein HWV01_03240 [Moritella sp. 5]|uniref:hypothetical protein n=1 Tax=Moritella sp. 5 TaxID=2746231 RepID=UPI001BA54674|nr:hypothetical protein [Moritella sp. 5]QUM79388.1 hypothetical protein HWV01_03240 [Moritella sp. 5]
MLSQIKKVYMNQEIYRIILEDGIFEKTFLNLTFEQVNQLLVHSMDVSTSLSDVKGVISPVCIEQNGKSIRYSLHELGVSFSDLIYEHDFANLIEKSAEILSAIHKVDGLMHSDFVLHNLFKNADQIYVIDSNPPALLGFRKDMLYGEQRHDVFSFLHSIMDSKGMKLTLLNPFGFFKYSNVFLDRYGYRFRFRDIIMLLKYVNNVRIFRKKAGRNQLLAKLSLPIIYLFLMICLGLRINVFSK